MKVGPIIAALREEHNLTQRQLAEYLNLSPSSISNYEHGINYPDLVTIDKLANLFHVTTDYLLGRTKYRCPPENLDQYLEENSKVYAITNVLLHMDTQARQHVEQYIEYIADKKEKPEE